MPKVWNAYYCFIEGEVSAALPQGLKGRICPLPFPGSSGCQHSFTCGFIIFISTSIFTSPSLQCLFRSLAASLLQGYVWLHLGAAPIIQDNLFIPKTFNVVCRVNFAIWGKIHRLGSGYLWWGDHFPVITDPPLIIPGINNLVSNMSFTFLLCSFQLHHSLSCSLNPLMSASGPLALSVSSA